MSTQIIDVPMPFEPQERRLVPSNSHWAALLDIAPGWTNIRFGWRWAIENFNSINLWDTQCYMGMMTTPDSGITNGPLSWQTAHFVGTRRINYANYTVAAVPYWATSWQMSKKIGTTITNGAPAISQCLMSSDPSQLRTAHFLDIVKGSPNYTITHITCEGVSALLDIEERSVIEDAMNTATPATVASSMNTYIGGGGTRYTASGATVAVNEGADGTLTSFVCGWPLQQGLYISEILFRVVA